MCSGVRPLLLYSPEEGDFAAIMSATPGALQRAGLFGPLAIEWRDGPLRAVSERLVARALGAKIGYSIINGVLYLILLSTGIFAWLYERTHDSPRGEA